MTVILVDPRRPYLVPVEAVAMLGGDLQYTEEMPIRVPWSLPSARPVYTGADAPVLLSSDRRHPEVRARLAAGERLIAVEDDARDGNHVGGAAAADGAADGELLEPWSWFSVPELSAATTPLAVWCFAHSTQAYEAVHAMPWDCQGLNVYSPSRDQLVQLTSPAFEYVAALKGNTVEMVRQTLQVVLDGRANEWLFYFPEYRPLVVDILAWHAYLVDVVQRLRPQFHHWCATRRHARLPSMKKPWYELFSYGLSAWRMFSLLSAIIPSFSARIPLMNLGQGLDCSPHEPRFAIDSLQQLMV